jgi:hypothetical protein
MEVELYDTLRADTFMKKQFCKSPGCVGMVRMWEFVGVAANLETPKVIVSKGCPLLCTQCSRRTEKLYMSTDGAFVCEQCDSNNFEKEAQRLHMQDILCE